MMVETILESSQDFGMANGVLPQWKRELLQRRAARGRPPPAPAPPVPPADDDEELRYGPGIVKRLKSRYLSLALREAPRRRPSVLRRAASLEHLLDERPPPAPASRPHARPARPLSVAAPPHAACGPRRDCVKRARSVDALSRFDSRDEPPAPPPPPPPPPPPAPAPRAARPPRRPAPLLREAERPPADLVRSTLRKFESTPARRAAPAARVSAVLRSLEGLPRSSTPEPRGRSPSPAATDLSVIDAPEAPDSKQVSKRALEGIARAGSSVLYSFAAARAGSHLPPLAACNPVLAGRARRVGVIRPMPPHSPAPADDTDDKMEDDEHDASIEKDSVAEPRPRTPPETIESPPPRPSINGHATQAKGEPISRIGAAGIERAWTGADDGERPGARGSGEAKAAPSPWGAGRSTRPAAPAATSVVFNFCDRKEVPDYVENDGTVRRPSRRNMFKAGEAGVVVLRAEGEARAPSPPSPPSSPSPPPSPLAVRFVNDNVLINGRSSIASGTPNLSRTLKLKLQFDDSLTRTFEYPSESSLVDEPPAPPAHPAPPPGLASNTHIVSSSLCEYTPSKTCADTFVLGVTPRHVEAERPDVLHNGATEGGGEGEGGDPRPCGAGDARVWSEARTHTDLLF